MTRPSIIFKRHWPPRYTNVYFVAQIHTIRSSDPTEHTTNESQTARTISFNQVNTLSANFKRNFHSRCGYDRPTFKRAHVKSESPTDLCTFFIWPNGVSTLIAIGGSHNQDGNNQHGNNFSLIKRGHSSHLLVGKARRKKTHSTVFNFIRDNGTAFLKLWVKRLICGQISSIRVIALGVAWHGYPPMGMWIWYYRAVWPWCHSWHSTKLDITIAWSLSYSPTHRKCGLREKRGRLALTGVGIKIEHVLYFLSNISQKRRSVVIYYKIETVVEFCFAKFFLRLGCSPGIK